MAVKLSAPQPATAVVMCYRLVPPEEIMAISALPGLSDQTRRTEDAFVTAINRFYQKPGDIGSSLALAEAACCVLRAQKFDIVNLLSTLSARDAYIRTMTAQTHELIAARDAQILLLQHELQARPVIVAPVPHRPTPLLPLPSSTPEPQHDSNCPPQPHSSLSTTAKPHQEGTCPAHSSSTR